MSIQLAAIAFNRDTTSATADAINLRVNNHQGLTIPEWRAGISRDAGDSVACYALEEIAGRTLTIAAQFVRRDPTLQRAEIRTVSQPEPLPVPVPGFPYFPYYLYSASPWQALFVYLWYYSLLAEALPSAPGVLGDVEPREVTFAGGNETPFETCTLRNVGLQSRGVGVHQVTWRWQYRVQPQDPWSTFAVSRHLIYSILATPTAPWVQQPYVPGNTQLPWAEALDLACRWAAGARTRDEAATRITEAVYGTGGERVEYDCVGPSALNLGSPHYTLIPGVFDCTEFLERVRGGFGNGRYVNCSDCASAVATLSNIVGCDLWESRMFGAVPFPLNPTRAIGSPTWLSACSLGAYNMHEVAWKNNCTEQDEVFDASLQIDGDLDPTRAPHSPRFAANIRFGFPGEGQYRDRLASPAGRLLCQPQPLSRQRRFVI